MICAGGGRLKGMVGYRGVYSIFTNEYTQYTLQVYIYIYSNTLHIIYSISY